MTNGRPRRRSIFGGFLIFILGVFLLLNNFYPELGGWELFKQWWPVLLILWGLAKMFDYLVARRTGEAPPPALSGGEVLLLLLLLMFVGTISAISWLRHEGERIDVSLPWDRRFTFSEEVVKPAKAGAAITLAVDRGDISVEAEDAPQIRVVVKKTALASSEFEASKRAEQVTIQINEVAGGYEIRPQTRTGPYPRDVRLDLEVHVPRQATLSATTERGSISVAGLAGDATVTSRSGDITCRDIDGSMKADMRGGDARITGVKGSLTVNGRGSEIEISDVTGEASVQGEFYGPIRIRNAAKGLRYLSQRTDLTIGALPGRMEMVSGNLEIYDVPSSVALVTRNRDVTLENVAGRIRIENRHGDIHLLFRQAPQEEVDIANESGRVELTLPSKSAFELLATSRGGEIESEFQDPALKLTQFENSSTLQGKLGTRGPRMHVRTTYGTIHLRKID